MRTKPAKNRKFSPRQYKLLRRCALKKDMTDWNEWRVYHPSLPIFLEGADLNRLNLGDANLAGAFMNNANLNNAHIENSFLTHIQLNNAQMKGAHFQNVEMPNAQLSGANMTRINLQGAQLHDANLEGAQLHLAHLEGANLSNANLQDAHIREARLEKTKLSGANLKGTLVHFAVVDGETMIDNCTINEKTIFNGVGLDSCRMDPELKQDLEYARRRGAWETWYTKHPLLKFPAATFWTISDYGRSITSILATFLFSSILFSIIYAIGGDNLINNLTTTTREINGVSQLYHFNFIESICRTFYFSIVTMTTLGYGDMYASTESIWGYILLTSQVLFGYVLLGALITRLGMMFGANGPNSNMNTQVSSLKAYLQIITGKHAKNTSKSSKKGRPNQSSPFLSPPPLLTTPASKLTQLPSRQHPASTYPNAESTWAHASDKPHTTPHAP